MSSSYVKFAHRKKKYKKKYAQTRADKRELKKGGFYQ